MPGAARDAQYLVEYPVGGMDWSVRPEQMRPGQYEILLNADPSTGAFEFRDDIPPAGALLAPTDLSGSGIPGSGHSSTRWNGKRWYISLDGNGDGNEPKVFFTASFPEDGTSPPLGQPELETLVNRFDAGDGIPCYDATHQALHVYAKDDNVNVVALAQTPDGQALVVFTLADTLAITRGSIFAMEMRHVARDTGTFNRRTVWQDGDGVFWLSRWTTAFGPSIRLWRFPGEPLSAPIEGFIATYLDALGIPSALEIRKEDDELVFSVPLTGLFAAYGIPDGTYFMAYNLRTQAWHMRDPNATEGIILTSSDHGGFLRFRTQRGMFQGLPLAARRYLHRTWVTAGADTPPQNIAVADRMDHADPPLNATVHAIGSGFATVMHPGRADISHGNALQARVAFPAGARIFEIIAELTPKEMV